MTKKHKLIYAFGILPSQLYLGGKKLSLDKESTDSLNTLSTVTLQSQGNYKLILGNTCYK